MSVKKVNKTTGATTKVAGLVNSEKVNTMYGAFPSDASASNKLVSDATADEKISDESQVIFEVMGKMGAKNIIDLSVGTQTINGVTITVQDDKSIILNGTATKNTYFRLTKNGIPFESGKCILSGVSGGSRLTYFLFTATLGGATLFQEIDGQITAIRSENGDSAIFDINKMRTESVSSYVDPSEINISLAIMNEYTCDNVLIKPMIRLASITDDTYESYAKTNRQLTEDKAEQTEVNDIVNTLGAKNLLPYNLASIIANNTNGTWSGNNCTKNGVTFTVNDDGSITVNGTATANAFLDICTKNAFTNSIFTANLSLSGVSEKTVGNYTLSMGIVSSDAYLGYTKSNNTVWLVVDNGKTVSNLTVYPMIRLASIQDDTYEPYAKTNRELTKDANAISPILNILGAKNLIPYPYYDGNSKTSNGITYTVDSEGVVNVNGTASAISAFDLAKGVNFGNTSMFSYACENLPIGSYTLTSGLANGGNADTIFFRYDKDTKNTSIVVKAGASINNVKVYPMIRLASIDDNTYAPYAMTNRDITKVLGDTGHIPLELATGIASGDINYRIVNGICFVVGRNIVPVATGNSKTIAEGVPKAGQNAFACGITNGGLTGNVMYVDSGTTVVKGHFGAVKTDYFTLIYPVE